MKEKTWRDNRSGIFIFVSIVFLLLSCFFVLYLKTRDDFMNDPDHIFYFIKNNSNKKKLLEQTA